MARRHASTRFRGDLRINRRPRRTWRLQRLLSQRHQHFGHGIQRRLRRHRPRRRGGWKLSDAAPSARRNPDWREHARALGFALADNAGAPYLGETAHRTFTAVEPASPWRRATLAEASVLATGSVVFGLLNAACLA
jgi:hypothetical protein